MNIAHHDDYLIVPHVEVQNDVVRVAADVDGEPPNGSGERHG